MEGAERERREERGRKPERKAGEEVMEERRERGGVWGLLHAVLDSRLPTVRLRADSHVRGAHLEYADGHRVLFPDRKNGNGRALRELDGHFPT